MEYYETVQGDTFDLIAKKVYGKESQMAILFEVNPAHMSVVIFPAGVSLCVPKETAATSFEGVLPAWRSHP